jgi:hypothetical protein
MAVATVSLTSGPALLYVGQTAQLAATARDVTGAVLTGRPVTWSSGSPGVATVSAAGVVTAVAPGTAVISAAVEGKTASVVATVALVPVATVTITPANVSLLVGQAQPLTATARDGAGNVLTGRPVTWNSGTPGVATVSTIGVVTAIDTGRTTIRATVTNGDGSSVSASLSLVVLRPVVVGLGPAIGTLQLPGGQVGVPYSQLVSASGGDGRYSFTVVQGRWPAGISLGGDGAVTGVPTAADSVEVTIRVTSAGLASERSVQMRVYPRDDTQPGGSCSTYADVTTSRGGFAMLAPPSGSGSRETCIRLPRSTTGRTMVALAADTWAGLVGERGGDLTPSQVAYDLQPVRSDAIRAETLDPIPNPAIRAPRLWSPIGPPGGAREAPATYRWLWMGETVPSRLVYQGTYVNYYEDTTAALAQRGTLDEWRAIDAAVTDVWARMDTLYGPLVDLDRDGRFAILAKTGISGANAYYSVCALAPGWSGAVSDTAIYNCGSEKARDHAVIPVVGNFRRGSPSATAQFIVGPILHETVHARQHMLTLQVPGRDARENRCGIIMYFRARPTAPPPNCGEYGTSIRSTLLVEGMANSLLPVLLNHNWTNSCLSGTLLGQCNLNDEPYNNGQLFSAWMILRAGRSIWPEALFAGLSATTAVDGLRTVTGIAEGTWFAMFLASLMLDDTSLGERLGLHWSGLSLASRMGFASAGAQWSAHPVLGTASYEAVRLRYGGGTVLRIDHGEDLMLRVRVFAGGSAASLLVIPEVAK